MANKVLIEVIATSKGLKVVAKDTDKVVTSTRKLDQEQKKQSKTQDKVNKQKDKTNKQDKALYQGNLSAAKGFSKMKETIGGGSSGLVQAYATLAANVFAATAAFTALRQASQVTQLVEGLQALGAASGKNLELLAVKIKEASGNAVDLAQSLRTASVGASAGFDPSQIQGLAAVARDAAIALGRDVGDAVDRLSRGAAKLEPEILDELGIFVRLDDASAKYAAQLGVASSELTRFQQRQAFANEIIEQGARKFGELGDTVDASPFDRLAATLGDLSRTVMDAFNKILGPVAGFLSENTLALAGLFAILTRGIIATALPMLNKFSEAAIKASGVSMNLAITEEKKAERQIQAQRKVLKPLNMVKGEYGKLFGKIKQGTATLAEQELANKKLLATIQTRQRNVLKGGLKNVQQKKEELRLIKVEQRELQKLINMEKGREGNRAAAQFFGAQGNFERRGGNILGNLDADIAKGDVLGGFNKALKAASRNSKKLIKDTKATTGTMKILNFTVGTGTTKALRLSGSAFKIFGLTGRIAIKGLFTAIPVIGQLLLVVDLLIAGLKKAIGFFGGFGKEVSELEKVNKQFEMALEGVNAQASELVINSKSAGRQLVISANATSTLLDATKEQSEQQAKASKEAGIFGRVLQGLGRDIQIIGLHIQAFFKPIATMFDTMSLRIEKRLLKFKINNVGLINGIIKAANVFLDDDEKIEVISAKDTLKNQKRVDEITSQMESLESRMKNTFNRESLGLLGDMAKTSAEFKSFNAIIEAGGPAYRELSEFLGTGDFNEFVKDIKASETALNGLDKKTDATIDTFSMFSPEVAKLALSLVEEDEAGKKSIDTIKLLGAVLNQGTATTIDAGKATQDLGQTFQNSGEKISTFFTNLREKSKLGTTLGMFKQINELIESTRAGEGGDNAFLEEFEKAPVVLQEFLIGTERIANVQKGIADIQEGINDGVLDEAMGKEAIAAIEKSISKEIEDQSVKLQNPLAALVQFELVEKKRLAIMQQQASAISKVKNNSEAVTARVVLQNKISNANVNNLKTQNSLNEQSLGLSEGQRKTEAEVLALSTEQKEIYAKILSNDVAIAKEEEKIVGEAEKQQLINQANLETTKLGLDLQNAEVATLAKKTKLLSLEANIRAGIGGKLTPAQQLKAQRLAANEAVKAAIRDQDFQIAKFNIEVEILKARLLAAKVEEKTVNSIITKMQENFEVQKDITAEKVKQAELDEKLVGKDKFKGLLSDSFAAQQGSAIGLAAESLTSLVKTDKKDEDGNVIMAETQSNATTQERLEALSDATKPMRDALMELGPEGELVATAQQGVLTMASAFDVFMTSADKADKLGAVGAAIGAVSQIMAANSKAQIAEIDKQIEAEKKRDGKSAESIQKIKAMEKKKEAMQKKAFEQNKKMQMAQTIVNTASGIMKAYTDYDTLTATALAVMIGAMGAAQLAIISKQQFQGGSSGDIEKPNTSLTIGKRSNAVDVSRSGTSGELNYLRGGRTQGQNIGGAGAYLPGSAMGRKGYAMGFKSGYADGGVVVGERGPEVITPSTDVDIVPNFALGGGETNVNFSINAIDAAGVEDVLSNQRGNIIRMIREAANENGERFLEMVDTQTYGSNT